MGVDLESLSEATSGAIGSLLSTTILYPLDTCKTRYQADVGAHGQQKYRLPISSFLILPFLSFIFHHNLSFHDLGLFCTLVFFFGSPVIMVQ